MTETASLSRLSLWSARVPYFGLLASHHWFVVERDGHLSRWEVWQSANTGGKSWGHLHQDLMSPFAWPHKDDPVLHECWQGSSASALIKKIESSPEHYPWQNSYRYWPGPNSNTYAQWVLEQHYRLGWKAVGKHYSRLT